MERKKQIEEMARDIAKRDCYLYENCPKEPKHNCVSQDPKIMLKSSKNYITVANWLVKEDYRKITKNEVVISKGEYERLKRVETEKDRLYEIKLDLEHQLIQSGLTEYIGADEIEKQARKETAEKILKEFDGLQENLSKKITQLKEHFNRYMNSKEKEGYEKAILAAKSIITSFKSRLAKQFGVEI